MTVRIYRKIPVEIQAIQYRGIDNIEDCFRFLGRELSSSENIRDTNMDFIIPTLEGEHVCSVGDYIIRGIKGEFYPCKPDIFKKIYEEA